MCQLNRLEAENIRWTLSNQWTANGGWRMVSLYSRPYRMNVRNQAQKASMKSPTLTKNIIPFVLNGHKCLTSSVRAIDLPSLKCCTTFDMPYQGACQREKKLYHSTEDNNQPWGLLVWYVSAWPAKVASYLSEGMSVKKIMICVFGKI